MRTLIAILTALMLFATTPVVADDFADAWKAYLADDHQEYFRLTKRMAEQGDFGSQFVVGALYFGGQGVPQDYVRAYAWFNIAAAQGPPARQFSAVKDSMDNVANLMTPAQIAEAQKLSRELWEKYVVPFQKE